MAKKRKQYTDEEKLGKRGRLGMENEPEGILQEPQVQKIETRMRQLSKYKFHADNHNQRIRLEPPDNNRRRMQFINQMVGSHYPLLEEFLKLPEVLQQVIQAYKWTQRHLRYLRSLDQADVMDKKALQKAYDDHAAEVLKNEQLRQLVDKLEKELKERQET